MKKAKEVLIYLETKSQEMKNLAELATLQKEELFYYNRYVMLREMILELRTLIEGE